MTTTTLVRANARMLAEMKAAGLLPVPNPEVKRTELCKIRELTLPGLFAKAAESTEDYRLRRLWLDTYLVRMQELLPLRRSTFHNRED